MEGAFGRVVAAETDPKGSIAEPDREHRSSTDHSAYGQCDGKSAAASHPDDLQDAGKPAPVAGLCTRPHWRSGNSRTPNEEKPIAPRRSVTKIKTQTSPATATSA